MPEILRPTALVTGAAKGIGAAIAQTFAKNGYDLILHYHRSETACLELQQQLSAYGGRVICVRADLSSYQQVRSMFEKIGELLDVLVNNAGIAEQKILLDLCEEDWDRMLAVNLKSVFACTKFALPYLLKSSRAAVINIASMWGIAGAAAESHYAAAKAGLIGFSKSLAKELCSHPVRVNCVAPGVIETDMMAAFQEEEKQALIHETPLGRLGRAEDVAKAVLFLAEADFITGQVLSVDGGFLL